MITWKDIIEIIGSTFQIHDYEIAKLLNYDKTTISRIKSGERKPPFTVEGIFEKIFDPETQESPANDTEENLLELLKDIIEAEFPAVKRDIDDCWKEENYKTFVMKLLSRTRYIPLPKDEDKTATPDSKIDTLHTQAPVDIMLQIFKQTYREYHIIDLLGAELFPGLDPKLLIWGGHFIKTIEHDILECFESQKSSPMYINIKRYNRLLGEYVNFLKENTHLSLREDRLIPKNNDCKESVNHYRRRLIALRQEICGNIFFITD